MSPFGGNEFPGGGGGSGGGTTLPSPSQPGESVYWNGTMWVATNGPLVIAGPESTIPVQIPGLSGSPDIIPVSPGAHNDEFDSNFNGVNSPWTAFNAPDVSNTSDVLSHLHLRKNAQSANMAGWYQAPPATPFTMTCKLSDVYLGSSPNRASLFVCSTAAPQAASGTIIDIFLSQNSGAPTVGSNNYAGYTASGTGGISIDTNISTEAAPPIYFRFLITSANSWVGSWSKNGLLWNSGSVANPGFVPLSVGVSCNCIAATGRGEAFFDWVRFT